MQEQKYTYDPFGRLIASSGTYKDYNDYLFSTKRYERQWGLNYYGYRFYSADLGRWINRDPIGEQGGLNLYGFVGNRPVGDVDALGMYNLKIHGFTYIEEKYTKYIFDKLEKEIPKLIRYVHWHIIKARKISEACKGKQELINRVKWVKSKLIEMKKLLASKTNLEISKFRPSKNSTTEARTFTKLSPDEREKKSPIETLHGLSNRRWEYQNKLEIKKDGDFFKHPENGTSLLKHELSHLVGTFDSGVHKGTIAYDYNDATLWEGLEENIVTPFLQMKLSLINKGNCCNLTDQKWPNN